MESIPAPVRSIVKNVAERYSGSRPGVFKALLPSIAVGVAAGVAVGVVTYKLQRSGG